MLKTITKAAVAATFVLSASAGFAQVNLTSNAAGAGTAGALSATSLVENAAERGIANIQMKDGQTGTKYVMALAEGKIDLASGPFILPFLMAKAARWTSARRSACLLPLADTRTTRTAATATFSSSPWS